MEADQAPLKHTTTPPFRLVLKQNIPSIVLVSLYSHYPTFQERWLCHHFNSCTKNMSKKESYPSPETNIALWKWMVRILLYLPFGMAYFPVLLPVSFREGNYFCQRWSNIPKRKSFLGLQDGSGCSCCHFRSVQPRQSWRNANPPLPKITYPWRIHGTNGILTYIHEWLIFMAVNIGE